MKHALRKYISPCGSALFMVVSTMAALIVLVTAMYMSVLSSRQVQYATFDQEQAYVSSTSIADILGSYIADGKNSGSDLVKKVLALKPSESLSTNGNGFASLVDGGTAEDTPLGGYTVDVTRLNDEKISGTTWHVFDLAVTVSQNGVMETTHTYLRTKDPEPNDMPPINRFFTATGYVPNDVLVSAININSTAYYDSELVRFGEINSGYTDDMKPNTVTIRDSLICAGSAVFDKENNANIHINVSEPTDWFFGNNMTIEGSTNGGSTFTCSLGGNGAVESSEKRGRIFIGGNLDITGMTNIGSGNAPTDVYVLGDVNISAPFTIYGNLYVGGNLTISNTASFGGQSKIYHSNKTMNLAPNPWNASMLLLQYNGSYALPADVMANKWDESTLTHTVSKADVGKMLDSAIGASLYPKWQPDIDDAQSDVKDIIFNGGTAAVDPVGIEVLKKNGDLVPLSSYYDEVTSAEIPRNCTVVIDHDCTIGEIVDIGTEGPTAHTIIFDTGDAGDVLTINLQANMKLNGSDEPNGFSWAPAYTSGGVLDPYTDTKLEKSTPGMSMSILTVGDGTLIVNVPDGVTYQAADYEFFGHYAWFALLGGSYSSEKGTYVSNISEDVTTVQSMIHKSDGCTDCEYIAAKNSAGEDGFTCLTHGGFVEQDNKPEDCACESRVEKNKFTGSKYDYEGTPQEGNVNIWIVSCSESADIQIGCKKYVEGNGKSVRNEYFGYIYAPYMTYMDMSASNGHGLKCCGGLIVSDYVMSGYYDYVYALPDDSLEELVGDNFDPLTPNASRSWRIHGV